MVAGEIGGGLINYMGQHSANKTNIKLARENRDWEEQMSNTAWQRGVNDMMKAGINPMLAISQGPASTPSNSAATVASEGEGLGRAVTSAASTIAMKQQQQANVQLTNAQTYKTTAEGNLARFLSNPEVMGSQWDTQQAEIKARTKQMLAGTNLTDAQKQQIEDMLPLLKATEITRAKVNEQQTSSAQTQQELDQLRKPELEATAKWFENMGTSGKTAEFGKSILMLLKQVFGR